MSWAHIEAGVGEDICCQRRAEAAPHADLLLAGRDGVLELVRAIVRGVVGGSVHGPRGVARREVRQQRALAGARHRRLRAKTKFPRGRRRAAGTVTRYNVIQ